MDDDSLPGRVAEYSELRAEIRHYLERHERMTDFTLLVAGGAAALSTTNVSPVFYFAAPLLVSVLWFDANRSIRAVHRVAAYLRVVLEPSLPGTRWETLSYGHPFHKQVLNRLIAGSIYPLCFVATVGMLLASRVLAPAASIGILILASLIGGALMLVSASTGAKARDLEAAVWRDLNGKGTDMAPPTAESPSGPGRTANASELMTLYQMSQTDIHWAKAQMWQATNWGLLAMAAVVGISRIHFDSGAPLPLKAPAFVTLALLLALLAALYVAHLHVAMVRSRLWCAGLLFELQLQSLVANGIPIRPRGEATDVIRGMLFTVGLLIASSVGLMFAVVVLTQGLGWPVYLSFAPLLSGLFYLGMKLRKVSQAHAA